MPKPRELAATEEDVYLRQKSLTFDIPRLFLIGPSGSGKTAIGRKLARDLQWELIDTDQQIRAAHPGLSIAEIFEREGEPYFREREMELLRDVESVKEPVVVATGGGLPAIPGAMDRIEQLGVSVYLHAGIDDLWLRLIGDLEDRPLLRNGGRKRLEELIEARDSVYRRATISIDTSRLTVDAVVRLLSARL